MERISRLFILIVLMAIEVSCVSGQALNNWVGDSWLEDIRLHDGSSMIIKRNQTYKGRHEIGQATPVGQHIVSFTVPQTGKTYTWVSEYSEKFGRTNFVLLAIHVLDGVPYVVVEPNFCLAYNFWGRPNPPYLFFKNVDNTWKRIELADFPKQFTSLNVLIHPRKEDIHVESPISANIIMKKNVHQSHPEYQFLYREPLTKGNGLFNCPDWSDKRYSSPQAPVQPA